MLQYKFLRPALLLAIPLISSLSVLAQAPPPVVGEIETVHSSALRLEFEEVISRGGWYLIGNAPEHFRIGTGFRAGSTRKYSGFLQSCDYGRVGGFGVIERTIPADGYLGKRIRVAGRIDNSGDGYVSFYAHALHQAGAIMQGRVKQPSLQEGWQTIDLVMEVPADASVLEIGVTLRGSRGTTVWLDNVAVEIIGDTVPLAGALPPPNVYQRGLSDPVVSCDGEKY